MTGEDVTDFYDVTTESPPANNSLYNSSSSLEVNVSSARLAQLNNSCLRIDFEEANSFKFFEFAIGDGSNTIEAASLVLLMETIDVDTCEYIFLFRLRSRQNWWRIAIFTHLIYVKA